ncbi:MAG: dephospho-CoA kinase, partial [Sphingomonadales bacterium]
MGKSTAAAMLRRLGRAVFDADASVHSLMGPKGAALPALAQLFPGAVGPRGLDRQAVGAQVFASPEKKAALEALLHPMVRRLQKGFLDRQRRKRAPLLCWIFRSCSRRGAIGAVTMCWSSPRQRSCSASAL